MANCKNSPRGVAPPWVVDSLPGGSFKAYTNVKNSLDLMSMVGLNVLIGSNQLKNYSPPRASEGQKHKGGGREEEEGSRPSLPGR